MLVTMVLQFMMNRYILFLRKIIFFNDLISTHGDYYCPPAFNDSFFDETPHTFSDSLNKSVDGDYHVPMVSLIA